MILMKYFMDKFIIVKMSLQCSLWLWQAQQLEVSNRLLSLSK